MKITILGDGGWGTTLAVHLYGLGNSVKLWGAFPDYIKVLDKKRENTKFLPGVKIPKDLVLTSDLKDAIDGADIILLAVPSQHMRGVLGKLKKAGCSHAKIISATKGIENDKLLRMSEVIKEILGDIKLSVLSGPSIAYEVARYMPTTVVVASTDKNFAREVQSLFMSENFRVYTSPDIIGVELGGSLKNVVAVASGIADGLGFGANSKAAILTRGLREITRLGVAMGADKETFSGLSCMGDLITTCMSKHSRNRWLGEELGKGKKPQDIIKSTEMVLEGFSTTKSVYKLAKKKRVDMPITNEMYAILHENKDPKEAVSALMTRAPKDEIY
ncbi:MAG: NAD(P)-dependent glycerol-3-phosphate dehydrogenase [Candidatus Omnitrophica bacterium]|nr:NAD(P)-dependent glycerol-3-phosphate dehydrogenase [Candidatus Omnitrophota bacterium]